MTEPTSDPASSDTALAAQSPNPNPRKKTRDKTNLENPDEMQVESIDSVRANLFGDAGIDDNTNKNDSNNNNEKTHKNNNYDNKEQPGSMTTPENPKGNRRNPIYIYDSDDEDDVNSPDPDKPRRTIFDFPVERANAQWETDYNPAYATLKPYTTADMTNSNSTMTALGSHAKKLLAPDADLNKPFDFEQWWDVFEVAWSNISPNDERHQLALATRVLAIRLAKTDPTKLFLDEHWNEGALNLDYDVTCLWTAAYVRYGAPWCKRKRWHPDFPTWSESQKKTKNREKKLSQTKLQVKTNDNKNNTTTETAPRDSSAKKRTPDGSFKDISTANHTPRNSTTNPAAVSNNSQNAKTTNKSTTNSATTDTSDRNDDTTKKNPPPTQVTISSKTKPQSIMKKRNNHDANNARPPQAQNKTHDITEDPSTSSDSRMSTPKKTSFGDTTESPSVTASPDGVFLSKPLPAPDANPYKKNINKTLADVSCKYRTYIKIQLAPLQGDTYQEQEAEAIDYFKSVVANMWTIEPKLTIFPWRDGYDKYLRQNSTFSNTKEFVNNYVDRLWVQKSRNSYCRLLVGHDMTRTKLFTDPQLQRWLKDAQMKLLIERVQAKRLVKVGHLMGYHALVVDPDTLADAIQIQPAMKDLHVEIRVQRVDQEYAKGVTYDDKKKNVILTIFADWDKASKVRQGLVTLYSSAAKGKYPQGVQARFIPEISDTRFIRTNKIALVYKHSIIKHIKFMHSTDTVNTTNILALDHYVPELQTSLRKAIMHIRSTTTNWGLFVAVDVNPKSGGIDFAFRTELKDEALSMVTGLPLFLEQKTGSARIWNWFTPDAALVTADHKWHPVKGLCEKNESAVSSTKLEGWENLDDIEDSSNSVAPMKILHQFQLDLTKLGKKSYGDDQSFDTNIYKNQNTQKDDSDTESRTDSTVADKDDKMDDDDSSATNPPQPTHDNHKTTSITHHQPQDGSTTAASNSTSTLTSTPDKDSYALFQSLYSDPTKRALLLKLSADPHAEETLHLMMQQTQIRNPPANNNNGMEEDGDES